MGERELIKNEMNDLWLGLLKGKLGFTSSNLWRREILLKIGGFDVSLVTSEEYHLIFEILKTKVHIYLQKLPQPLKEKLTLIHLQNLNLN